VIFFTFLTTFFCRPPVIWYGETEENYQKKNFAFCHQSDEIFISNMNISVQKSLTDFSTEFQKWGGTAGVIANSIVIAVYFCSKDLRVIGLFIMLLSAGDSIQSLGFALSAFFLQQGSSSLPPAPPMNSSQMFSANHSMAGGSGTQDGPSFE
jgi:hypothetical protein